jgi:hypothetical protein
VNSDREARIRERAYAIWVAEGRPNGKHEDHWQRAAQEIATADSAVASPPKLPRRGSRRPKRSDAS